MSMNGKSNFFADDLLKLVFQAAAIPNLAQNGTSPITNIYIALHTADPGVGGLQTSNEAAYTGYSRVAVARTSGGWTVTGNSVSPVAAITFPLCTAGSETETFWSAGFTASPTGGQILYAGPISPTIAVSNGVTPQLTNATAVTEA
jgi:hypothetical protein